MRGREPEGACFARNGSGQQNIVKNDLNRLSDGKLYYFDARGRKITQKGWRALSSSKYIQIGAYGFVTAKMEKNGNVFKFYIYNYKTNQWEKQKNTWKTVKEKQYYFNKYGNCTKIYNTKTRKCQRYKNGRMHTVKKDMALFAMESYIILTPGASEIQKKAGRRHPISGTYRLEHRAMRLPKSKKAGKSIGIINTTPVKRNGRHRRRAG